MSPDCDLALVLFDEIEKAAPALTSLLLGMLDHATLHLGDNSVVNFEKALIFLTSNLGAREMFKEVRPDIIGFQPAEGRRITDLGDRLQDIGLAAVRKRFSPEFVNRIDAVITYRPLDAEALAEILNSHIAELQRHVHTRLGERSFEIEVSQPARELLLREGASEEYGARELKRTIHRRLTQPLAALVAEGHVEPGGRVLVDLADFGGTLRLRFEPQTASLDAQPVPPVVLIVDDNTSILQWLRREIVKTGATPLSAPTAQVAREIAARQPLDLAIVDLVLPDGDGLSVALELLRMWPRARVVVMTGADLTPDEVAVCRRQEFPVLRKPFLATDIVKVVSASLLRSTAAGR